MTSLPQDGLSADDSGRRNTIADTRLNRRRWLSGTATAAATAAVGWTAAGHAQAAEPESDSWKAHRGRINQSVVRWCWNMIDIDTLAREAADMGLKSVELVDPAEWPVLKEHGLICAISRSHSFVRGLNNPAYHDECFGALTAAIEATSAAGWPNVITFSGMREGLSDKEGKRNMTTALKQLAPIAEEKKVTLCIEPLNTRATVEMKGHPGYQCDSIEWAVDVCDAVGSPRVKILFDIYHVQIMQGDVIVRIRQFKDYIAHYHTAGVPGRNELDDKQENNYPAIMEAIAESGYQGYVGQEFIPERMEPLAGLRHAAKLCDV